MRKHGLVLLVFIMLALIVTWPLALNFTSHVVGDGSDDPALTWNIWWFKHALLDLQISPLATDYMFYPIGINLVFYTLTLLNDALALPIYALFGLVPAVNVSLLSSFVLCGYGAFLLAMYTVRRVCEWQNVTVAAAGAVVAGVVYAFSSNKLLYASLGQFNIASTQWIPFYVFFLFRLRDAWEHRNNREATRDVLMAALFLLLEAYAEFTFASFLVIFTAFFAIWQLRSLREGIRRIGWLAALGVVFAVGFLPVLVPMLAELRTEGDILVEGSGFAGAFSADLLGFFVPSKLNPLLGSLDSHFAFPYINFVFIGWLTLLLAIWGVWQYRPSPMVRFWAASTLAFSVIALGPELRIDGSPVIGPLPFVIFQWLPIFKGNRYPSRFSIMITLGIAMLVALAVQHIVTQFASRRSQANSGTSVKLLFSISPNLALGALLGSLILVEHWSTLPLNDYTVPSFYQDIRADTGDFTVLELPMAWRNGFRVTGALEDSAGKAFMIAQFFQTIHEQPMLSGNTSRNPEFKFQYFTEAPVINSLIALETGHELDAATLASDKTLAPTVFAFFKVRYIVVRPEAGPAVEPYLKSMLPSLTLWREADNVRVYRLAEPPLEVLRIDPKSPLARLYFGEGWGELGETRVWAQRKETRLILPSTMGRATLALRLIAPVSGQNVRVTVNGTIVSTIQLSSGAQTYQVDMPPDLLRLDHNNIELTWSILKSTGSLIDYGIRAPHDRSVVVKSAGEEVGDFAHIWIDGIDYSPNMRGYNVVRFNPVLDSSEPLSYSFDTFESSAQSQVFATTMKNMSWSKAFAIRDEASRNLTQSARDVLASYGSVAPVGWRWSHALVAYEKPIYDSKGNYTGSEILKAEDASPIRPAIVSIGERITAPQVAGAVESIELRVSP